MLKERETYSNLQRPPTIYATIYETLKQPTKKNKMTNNCIIIDAIIIFINVFNFGVVHINKSTRK